MSDDPNKRARDRELLSKQEHELVYLMRTANVSRQRAKEAVEKQVLRANSFGIGLIAT